MKLILPLFFCVAPLVFTSCGDSSPESSKVEESADIGIVDVDAEKAAELVASNGDLVILDVRTPEEFAEGHLAGAVNIDFKGTDFEEKVSELDTSKSYLLHCRSGGRSGASLPVFEGLGFSEVYHLNTGYLGWTEAGKPIEK